MLALVAYLPALATKPGRMPTDTKLYLYLNPGRLLSDALNTWDTRQFGGWVPHQVIAYLWPQGPWYWFFDRIGAPDWVAHRLWIGTLLFLAAAGVFWAARILGLTRSGAFAAAIVYQLSPYVLPYISRTSAMLLPWAAVGWLVGLTIRTATSDHRWRYASLTALVVLSCSAVNATAVMMIAPAPVLWLLTAVWQRTIDWRRAVGAALRIGVLSLGVSLWWIMMLRIQGTYGADVLSYSESLQATSFTSTSLETLRGMGYWLAYIRDPFAFTTTAARTYMESGTAILLSFALTGLCLFGLAVVRWGQRRYAGMLVFTGIVLAVGVHPIWSSSPLMRPLATHSRSGLALALRSSTRALPVSLFGMALGIGALVTALGATKFRWRALAAPAVAVLAIANLPALTNGGLVDPALERDQQPPAAWRQAAAALDASSSQYRVLELPGSEFGAFRWGYTVDPPLPGLTTKPLVTRDLLPLGSAAMMDLLYALDDRVQQGTLDPASLAGVARYLGVDTVWLANDLAFDRFRTPLPAEAATAISSAGLQAPRSFGPPTVNTPSAPMLDEHTLGDGRSPALPPVQLFGVPAAMPIVRTSSDSVLVAGSGDGVVDAVGAGVLDGKSAVVYAADVARQTGTGYGDLAPSQVVLTDSNRDRAHHWRSSQDVTGFTERGGIGSDVLRPDEGDQRLPVFGFAPDARDQTTAALDTGLVVEASGYGEPFAYRPEQRPAMAVDGNPNTAWVVADRANPVGEYLTVSKAFGELHLLQSDRSNATFTANRMITRVRLTSGDGKSATIALGPESLTGAGQAVQIPGTGALTITIEAVANRPGGTDTGPSGVGFAELGLGTNHEVVTTPRLPSVAATTPLSIVLTRLRVDAADRWRSDPEPTLDRSFTTAGATKYTGSLQLQLDRRATDAMLALYDQLSHQGGATASARLTGSLGARGLYATDGDQHTAWTSPFGPAIGTSLSMDLHGSIDGFDIWQRIDDEHSTISALSVRVEGHEPLTIAVPKPDHDGHSHIALPAALDGTRLTVTIADEHARYTIDRRYGERTMLPVAVSELQSPAIAPTSTESADLAPGCTTAPVSIDGTPLSFKFDTASMTALGEGSIVRVDLCGEVALSAGAHRLTSDPGVLQVDQVVLRNATPASTASTNAVTAVQRTNSTRHITVGPCPAGCWLIMGEGWNAAWTARSNGTDLGASLPIDGGSNGWWLPPSSASRTVDLTWGPQRKLDIALALSAISVIGCLVLAFRRRRTTSVVLTSDAPSVRWTLGAPTRAVPAVACAALIVAITYLVATPTAAVVSIAPAIVVAASRRPRVAALAGAILASGLGAAVLFLEHRRRTLANAAWPTSFEHLHPYGMMVIALLLAAVLVEQHETSD